MFSRRTLDRDAVSDGCIPGSRLFFVSYKSVRTRSLPFRKYLIGNIGKNPIRMIVAFLLITRIVFSEKPRALVSTGAEIAIPSFIVCKLLGIETIFIESCCRVRTKSMTGRIVYPLSDVFLVQWPQLCDAYGENAKYAGSIL